MVLLNTETGEKYDGLIEQIQREELHALKDHPDFGFDWSTEKDKEGYKIQLFNEQEILGLISFLDIPSEFRLHINLIESSNLHKGKAKKIAGIPGCLIAFVCKKAFLSGYDGFVSLTPKSELVEHYQVEYGFIQVGKQMAVFGQSAKLLITKYLDDEEV